MEKLKEEERKKNLFISWGCCADNLCRKVAPIKVETRFKNAEYIHIHGD